MRKIMFLVITLLALFSFIRVAADVRQAERETVAPVPAEASIDGETLPS